MKKYIFLLLTIFCLSSCNVIQDITFHKDGHVSFSMYITNKQLDYIKDYLAGDLQDSIWEKTQKIGNNTTADRLIDTSRISLTDQQREGLALLAKMQVRREKDIFTPLQFTIRGDFKNLDDLNKASAAVPLLCQVVPEFETFEKYELNSYFEQHFVYAQKGDVFSVHSEPMADISKEGKEEIDGYRGNDIRNMFITTYPYETRYTFPFDVKTVNNPNSSHEGRKVRILYPVSFFFKPEMANVIVNSLGDLYIPFTIGSSEVSLDNAAKIKELAEYLKANPNTDVIIIGSADLSTGSRKFNDKIAFDRGVSIANLLHEYGINQIGRVSVGMQVNSPLYKSDKKNRCAIIFLINSKATSIQE